MKALNWLKDKVIKFRKASTEKHAYALSFFCHDAQPSPELCLQQHLKTSVDVIYETIRHCLLLVMSSLSSSEGVAIHTFPSLQTPLMIHTYPLACTSEIRVLLIVD